MSDAQAEAERIVQRVAGDRVKFGPVAALFTDKHDAERVLNIERDRLVALLTAVIEETDAAAELEALRGSARQHGKERAAMRLGHAWNARLDALAALRQTDGEDT